MSDQKSQGGVSHLAPGSSAGVMFQLERALFWLAESESIDSTIGVEVSGDVFVLNKDSASIHEEDKHSVKEDGHPFGNHDKRLWRTIQIWCDATVNGASYERTARLLLVTNKTVPNGLVRDIHNAVAEPELGACIETMQKIAMSPHDNIKPTVLSVMKYDDAVLKDVLRRIELQDASAATSSSDLRKRIIGRLHLPPSVDGDFVTQALGGWVQELLLSKWRAAEPGWISRITFDTRLQGILTEIRMKQVLARSARLIPIDPQEIGEVRGRRFTEHLAQIAVEDEVLDEAIEDWLRFKKESLRLLSEGEIVPGHWEDRGHQLEDRWRQIARSEQRTSVHKPSEEVGQTILERTLDPNYQAQLAGYSQPEAYLTRGQYHRLADEDRVWWYPCTKPGY